MGAKTFWTQLEVISSNQEPERRAKVAGMNVVSNHHMRTGLLEARLRKMHEEEFHERRWNVAGMTK